MRIEGTWDAMGLRGTSSRDLVFDDAEVPAASRLGDEGQAGAVLGQVAGIFSLGMGATYLGMAQAALDRAGAYISTRVQFPDPAPLAHQQGLRFAFADAYTGLQSARRLLYYAGWLFEQEDEAAAVQVAAAKLACMIAGMRAADCAVQLSGGRGYLRGELVERVYRDIRAGALMTLNAEGCREAIAKPLLGVQ
jgi:alkylation response protein AidB-like acyl-CoA dehydrogenase